MYGKSQVNLLKLWNFFLTSMSQRLSVALPDTSVSLYKVSSAKDTGDVEDGCIYLYICLRNKKKNWTPPLCCMEMTVHVFIEKFLVVY